MADEKAPEPTALDAINSALESITPKAPDSTGDAAGDEPETDEAEGEEGTGEAPEGEAPAGEEDPEGEGPDGKKKDEAEETPEQKAARELAETPEQKTARLAEETKKKPDPINDPIPQTVAPRTRERITSLIKEVKDRDGIVEQHRELFNTIQSTGVSPENFGHTLTVLRLFNSDKIEDNRQAYIFLQSQVAEMAKKLGETVPGVDPLEGHADLKEAVEAQSISSQHAGELAAARNRAAAVIAANNANTQTQEAAAAEWNQANTVAKAALNALGKTLSGLDANYETKAKAVMAKITPTLGGIHPSKWVQLFQDEYAALGKKVVTVPGAKKVTGQPLRPNKQPAGGGQKQPGSALEAVEAALAGK